jgi:hypothetical protein
VANPSNDIYLSIWTHTTRLSTDVSNSAYAAILSNATTATNLLAVTQSATLPLGSDSARLLGRTVGTNATTRQRRSVASSAGTPDANIDAYAATWGNSTVMNRSVRGSGQSYVLYRVYMEHLTVSGRTFAAVDALDNDDAYTAALAAGGRYAGDTWTDPTTIP